MGIKTQATVVGTRQFTTLDGVGCVAKIQFTPPNFAEVEIPNDQFTKLKLGSVVNVQLDFTNE